DLRHSNFGARASTLQNGWDLSAFYYRSTDVIPTFYREVALAPAPTLIFTPRHDRIWQTGGTLAKDFGSVVGKAELIYAAGRKYNVTRLARSEEHTSELQSPCNLVCRLLLEKKKKKNKKKKHNN